jgi:hypothetical protein
MKSDELFVEGTFTDILESMTTVQEGINF